MAPDSSHLFIMGENRVTTPYSALFSVGSSSLLQVTRTTIESCTGSKLGKIRHGTSIERLEIPHRL